MSGPKSALLLTKYDATEYSFNSSDATGFPRALPPIRKIGIGRRALAGLVPSSKTEQGEAARFESSLERDFFVLLEFNGDVVRWDPQPVRISVPESGGSYTPDVLVSFVGSNGDIASVERVLYEVKFRQDLKENWSEYRRKFKAAYRYARAQGWRFRIITEREIRGDGLLWNAKFLLPYVYDEISDAERALLTKTLARIGPSTPKALLEACASDAWERARLLNAFWCLVATREVGADLTQRLTMNSEIWCYE